MAVTPLGQSLDDRLAELRRERLRDEAPRRAAEHQPSAIRPHDPGPQLHTYAENTATSEAEWLKIHGTPSPVIVEQRHDEIRRMKVAREAPRHSTPYLDMQKLGFIERRRKERETKALEKLADAAHEDVMRTHHSVPSLQAMGINPNYRPRRWWQWWRR